MGLLKDRHALVTGAGRGIGAAIAVALARHGAALSLAARSEDELQATAAACAAAGATSVAIEVVDLLDRDELAELCDSVACDVDVLVNNAGRALSAPLEKTDDDRWDDTLELNTYVPFALCRAALPPMAARGWGRIVNLASTAALEGYAYTAAYVASKHALLGITRALTAEVATRWPDADVTINAVCPGFVDTAIVREAAGTIAASTGLDLAAATARLAAMNPGGRLLQPQEVADAVLALALEQPGTTRGAAVSLPVAAS